MNHTYKVVYNESTNTYVAVAEFEPSKGKSKSSKKAIAAAIALAAAQLVPLTAQAAISIGSTSGNGITSTAETATETADKGVAVGAKAKANYTAVAVGPSASATNTDVAVGSHATATGTDNIAIGNNSTASSSSVSNSDYGIIAIGNQTRGSASETIAIGQWACATASQAVALGAKTQATGEQSVAIGGNAISSGAAALALGGDDLNKASSVGLSTDGKPNTTGSNINQGAVNTEFKKISGQNLVKATDEKTSTNNTAAQYMPTNAYGAASIAIGIQARSGDLATAFGTQSFATGLASTALGVASNASGNGSIAIGPGTDATGEQSIGMGANATSNNSHSIAIGTNATTSGNQSISVGYANNVSGNNSGAFGDASTITGSGAYAVGNNVTVSGSNTMVLGNNITAKTNGSVVLGNSSSGSESVETCSSANVSGITYGNFAGNVTDKGKYVSVGANATDARKIVNVAAGNISATSTEAINGSQLYLTQDIIANVANSTAKALSPNSTYDANGSIKPNITVNNGSSNVAGITNVEEAIKKAGWQLQANGRRVDDINAGDVVNFASSDGTVKVTGTADNAGSKIDLSVSTTTLSTNANGTIKDPTAPTNLVNASTVANAINNASWNVTSGKEDKGSQVGSSKSEQVKPGEEVKFLAGDNLVIKQSGKNFTYSLNNNVSLSDTGSFTISNGKAGGSSVVLNKHGLNNGGNTITNVANGTNGTDAVNVSQLKATKTVVTKGKNTEVTSSTNPDGSTVYTVSATVDPVTITNTTLNTKANGTTSYENGKGNNLVNASTVANAINNASWNVTSGVADKGSQDGASSSEQVKPGEEVKFLAGDNLVIKQSGQNFTYSLNNNISLSNTGSFTVGNTTVKDGSITISNGTAGSPVVLNKHGLNNGNNTITNVANGTNGTDAVNVNQLNATKTFVKGGDGVKVVSSTNANGSTVYTVGANTTSLTHNTNGTVAVPSNNGTNLVNASTVANAINNASWNVTSGVTGTGSQDGASSSEQVKPGEEVKFLAGDNLVIKQSGQNFTYSLNNNISLSNTGSFTVGNTTVKDGSITISNGTAGSPVVLNKHGLNNGNNTITNVANGTNGTDAVNVNQLNATKTFVKGGDGVKVVSSTNANGSTVYTVGANTTSLTHNTNGTVNVPSNNGTNLVNASTVANAINNASWNVTSGVTGTGSQDGASSSEQVKPGEEVKFLAGNNLVIKQSGQNFTYSLNNNISLSDTGSFTISNGKADRSVVLNKHGLNNGGNTITNVANGTNGTDAVNVSQLNATKTFVNQTDGIRVNSSTNANGATVYTVGANTTSLTHNTNGTVAVPSNNGTNLVNASTVANAINNASWNVTSGVTGTGSQDGSSSSEQVKPGEEVKFLAGNNLVIKQSGQNFTYSLSNNISLSNTGSFTVGNTTVKDGNITIANSTADGSNVTLNQRGLNNGNNTITNVAKGNISENSTDAINGSQLYSLGNSTATIFGGNTRYNATLGRIEGFRLNTTYANGNTYGAPATNIGDAITNLNKYVNEGWKVGNTTGVVETITPTEQVNFVNSSTLAANVIPNAQGGVNVSFDVLSGNVTVNPNGTTSATKPGIATITNVTEAINKSGWNITTNNNAKTSELINPGKTVSINQGSNIEVKQNGSNITIATAQNVSFNNVHANNSISIGNSTTGNVTLTTKTNSNGTTSLHLGNNTGGPVGISNVKNGDVSENSTDAVNGSQLYQIYKVVGGNNQNVSTTNTTIVNPNGTTSNVTIATSANYTMKTYNVKDQTEFVTNDVIQAIGRMNEEGIKFFHTNDENVNKSIIQANNSVDSSAAGAYSTALGARAKANGNQSLAMGSALGINVTTLANGTKVYSSVQDTVAGGESSIAMGTGINVTAAATQAIGIGYANNVSGAQSIAVGQNATVTGTQSIAIGYGNRVTGSHSGAFGDPTVVTGNSSYSIGNHNKLATDSTYALGSNITNTTTNSVFLGDNSRSFAQANSNLNASTGAHVALNTNTSAYTYNNLNSTQVKGVDNVVGVVSVGSDNATRQIQGVAAGVVSENSTDAINGSQLYNSLKEFNAAVVNSTVKISTNGNNPSPAINGVINFNNGNGTVVEKNGSNITINTPTTYVNKDGTKSQNATNQVNFIGAPVIDKNGNVVKDQNGNVIYNDVRLQKVAPGIQDNDAVNVGQLKQVANNLNNRINQVADDSDAGVASAMATAGLPQAFLPGKSMAAVAGSTYRGKQGYAVGFSAISDGGNWIVKGTASGNSKGYFGATVGAGYQW
ncbi:Knh-like trimeric autotransporter adhesin [Kingella negevensis]|uniref:Knh-like trimeric autotransporter adhesin n=1 Tax=Kingella negevensis TaxID=1522312 RepID=UPI00254E945E|nr:Knh-like trimeric autotransporter adhesin [Kingella negevensis]MDK4679406.1 Knh-like trimeric autotransporter adhesin [Kingella negevensis]MDK4691073.1 Knh-like trimeric autotransporter adhesin [Kingella negevensis]MDK4693780.1 Knh-like trimeric autotransporter adhesin [Kingella negevensis]MDK4700314.1 Knh-like trimeric autotransporter adhesin [Kingella negevensis]